MSAAVLWILLLCVDSCTSKVPRVEIWHHKTECEASRTELLDQAVKANRWVFARCVEQPDSGHFNYLQEGH
jgi:hypothetical protein